ncbi:MAG TPA: sigma-70 family RNA polymerase sigma factor [Kineosporiaceae bacterium]|nr:sigma-70 family RNA polymerase sigma factor [Kineosporiaceae bacterium]
MVAETPYPMLDGGLRPDGGVPALHDREVARLVAYLGSSDRGAGIAEAEDVAGQAFLEVATTWPSLGGYRRPEVYLYARAQRIAADRAYQGRPGWGDALAESAPSTLWGPPEVSRLTVLQDALDRLPEMTRHAVLLREMCGFGTAEAAEIIGVPESLVDGARGEALRMLVPAVEAGTTALRGRPGPLSPDDFLALNRALGHGDPERWAMRRRVAERLAGQARMGDPGRPMPAPAPSPAWSPRGPMTGSFPVHPGPAPGPASSPGWEPSGTGWSGSAPPWEPPVTHTALDAPLSTVDLLSVGTPIFDSVSAWFASGPVEGSGSSWAALDDGGWRAANARAAAEPEVAGLSTSGLPQRRPGANTVPSATDLGTSRSIFGEAPRVDAGLVRRRLDSYQQGLTNARRRRRQPTDEPTDEPVASRGWEALSESALVSPPPAPSGPVLPPNPLLRQAAGQAARSPEPFVDPEAFDAFYREYLPELLAALMAEGSPPAQAAQLAQEAMTDVRRRWSELDEPREWVRKRALAALVQHRRS